MLLDVLQAAYLHARVEDIPVPRTHPDLSNAKSYVALFQRKQENACDACSSQHVIQLLFLPLNTSAVQIAGSHISSES